MYKRDKLPTEEDLKLLSLRDIVAYAARAARRAQPLFQRTDELSITQEDVDAVDRAIRLAEKYSSREVSVEPDHDELRAAHVAVILCAHVVTAYSDRGVAARNAAHSAVAAIATAVKAEFLADEAVRYAADAANATVNAAEAAALGAETASARLMALAAAWHDYEQLFVPRFSFDLNRLGPLWPKGEPKWFSDAKLERDKSPVEYDVAAVASEHRHGAPSILIAWNPELFSEDDYARLVETMGDLARAEGGAGIRRLTSGGFGVPIGAGVP